MRKLSAENEWPGGTLWEWIYYPDELEFQDNSDLIETNNERVGERENEENSQEEIETFVKEQKSVNTTKKTVSDMKTFQRYLPSNCDENKD